MNFARNRIYSQILIMILLLSGGQLFASDTYENYALAWQKGMAGTGMSLSSNAGSIWLNSASVPASRLEAESDLSFLPAGISVSNLSVNWHPRSKLAIGAGINSENFGSFDRRDQQGNLIGSFSGNRSQMILSGTLILNRRLSLGYSRRFIRQKIDDRAYNLSGGQTGLILSDRQGITSLALTQTTFSDEEQPVLVAALSRKLAYLPLRLSVENRYEGKLNMTDTSIGAFIEPGQDFDFFAGLNFQRFDMQTQSLGDDFLAGLAGGAAWSYGRGRIYLSFYHYGGLGISSSMGVSYGFEK